MSRSQFSLTASATARILSRRSMVIGIGASIPPALVTPGIARRVLAQATPAATPESSGDFKVETIEQGVVTSKQGLFFDPSLVHQVTVSFDQPAFDAMVETFAETGSKVWIEATIAINGETFQRAGVRLKGNSSLGAMRNGGPAGMGPQTDSVPAGEVAALSTPAAASDAGETAKAEGGASRREGPGAMAGDGGMASADHPEKLPWLVKLDEFVADQAYQGLSQFVVRANGSPTALNESLALRLLTEAGLASQLAAYTAFSVNGSDPVLRLAIENPKTKWMKTHFSGDGLLWKAEAEGNWEYRGEDPASYVDIFDLEAGDWGSDARNVAPLASFLDFINNTDDDTFAGQLPDRLDVEQFATYLAMMDLIQNHDDITGPGNNAYLYVEPGTERITIVPWDMNLAFQEGFGGAQPTTIVETTDGGTPVAGASGGAMEDSGPMLVVNGTPVAGGIIPEGAGPTTAGGDAHAFGGMSNPLPKRFEANAAYAALITERTTAMKQELYAGGVASGILIEWATVLQDHARELVSEKDLASDTEYLQAIITGA